MLNKFIFLNLTNRCNYNCNFCCARFDDQKNYDLSLDIIDAFLLKHKDNCKNVVLCGGEPTIYLDFLKLIEHINNMGFQNIIIESNGLNLNDSSKIDYLLKRNANIYIISFHDYLEDDFNELTKNKHSFNGTVNAIKQLNNKGASVTTNTILFKNNYKRIKMIIDFLYTVGIRSFNISAVVPPNYTHSFNKELMPTYKELLPYISDAIATYSTKDVDIKLKYFPFCILNEFSDYRFFDDQSKIHFLDNDGEKYINSMEWIDYLCEKHEKCESCKFNGKCSGVFKSYIEKNGWEEFKPIIN